MLPHKPSYDSELGDAYFTVEEHQDLEPTRSDNSGQPLTWRGDPSETHSDWTIVVLTNELQTISYHVHKSVVCFGSRSSKYFARLLSNNEAKKMTKVELDAVDAVNFPILLDYIYAPCSYTSGTGIGTLPTAMSTLTSPTLLSMSRSMEDDGSFLALGEDVHSNNAVSIRYLARKFEIDSLTLAANRFIQKDLTLETAPRYLIMGRLYDDERLLQSATRLCVENFLSLDKKALTKLPFDVFRNLVMAIQGGQEEEGVERSCFLSEVVCRYLEIHTSYVTVDLLLELTEPSLMPFIAADAAIGFTALIKALPPEDVIKNWHELALFSRRCARSVVRDYGWNEFSVSGAVDEYLSQSANLQQTLSHTETLLFATSLAAALDQAQQDYHGVVSEQENLQQMLGNLNNTLDLMEKMNERKDKYLSYQSKALEEARQRIDELERELAEERRWRQNLSMTQPPTPPTRRTHTPSSAHQRDSPLHTPHSSNLSRSRTPPIEYHRPPTPSRRNSPYQPPPTYENHKSLLDDDSSRASSSVWGPQPAPPPQQPTKSLLDVLSMSRSHSIADDGGVDSFSTQESRDEDEQDQAIRDLVSPTRINSGSTQKKHRMREMRRRHVGNVRSFCGSLD